MIGGGDCVQETPQEHFLNAKARFQEHYDEEDAANLLFACNNLVNHGIELDWDDTLHKMEEILKEKAQAKVEEVLAEPEKEKKRGKLYVEDDEERRSDRIGISHYRYVDREDNSDRSEREQTGGATGRRKKGGAISEESLDFAPSRRFETASMDFPLSDDDIRELEAAKTPGSREDIRAWVRYHAGDRGTEGGGYSHIGSTDPTVIDTIYSDRPKGTYHETGDEHSWLNLFHENSPQPNLYVYLKSYYNPLSPFFVGEKDKEIDEHDRAVVTNAVGVEHPKNWTAAMHEVVRRDEERREAGEPAGEESRLHRDLGHMSPKVLGPIPEMMRSRLYERAFAKWDKWYQKTFPDSPLNGEGEDETLKRRILFLDHKMLKLDGCKKDFIKDALYYEDGTQRMGYPRIMKSESFTDLDNRDPKLAMGTRPLEYGLEMLDSDPEVDSVIEGKTALTAMAQQISHEMERDFRQGEELVNTPPTWEVSHWFHGMDEPTHIETRPYKKEDLEFAFCDDERGNGFTIPEFLNHMLRSQYIMTRGYDNAWTGHHSIEDGALQPHILGKDPNAWRDSLAVALRQAHQFFGGDMFHRDKRGKVVMDKETGKPKRRGIGSSGDLREKLASESPIYAKVRDHFSDFDSEVGLPMGGEHDYSSFPAVKKTLEGWLEKGVIDTADYEHLTEWLDIENGGYGDQTSAFRDWRAHATSKSWMLTHPTEPIDLIGLDLPTMSNMPFSQTHRMSPYFPTLTMFGRNGGLNLDLGDGINVYLQRNADLGREIMQSMMELSDMDPLPADFDKSAKSRMEHLPLTWSARNEVLDAYKENASLDYIYDNPATYPHLSGMLQRLASKPKSSSFRADAPDKETQAADFQEWKLNNKGLLARGHLNLLTKIGLRDRLAAILSHPDEQYKPLIRQSAKDVETNKAGFAHGSWERYREDAPGALGGAHGIMPLSTLVNRGLAHMVDSGRINRLVELNKFPVDLMATLALGPRADRVIRQGADKTELERISERMGKLALAGGEERLLERLERSSEATQVARMMSTKTGESSENQGNAQNNYTLRPHDTSVMTAARIRHGGAMFRGTDGDGSVEVNPKSRRSDTILRRNRVGAPDRHLTRMDELARLQATLWGFAGAKPLEVGGESVLTHPKALESFIKQLKGSKRVRDKGVDNALHLHESPFFRTKDMSEFWNNALTGSFPTTKDWRSSIESEQQHETYLYPVTEENGRYYLDMDVIDDNNSKELHAPKVSEAQQMGRYKDFISGHKNPDGNQPMRLNDVLGETEEMGRFRSRTQADADEQAEEAQKRARSTRLPVPLQCIVDTGPEAFMVASHPAELLAAWHDNVLGLLPRTHEVSQARHQLYTDAENKASDVVGDIPISLDEERDTTSESGLSVGTIAEIAKAEHDLAMGLQRGAIVPAATYAAMEDFKRDPDFYEGLDMQQMLHRFLTERISFDGNATPHLSKDHLDNAVRMQRVMELGHSYLANSAGKARRLMRHAILFGPYGAALGDERQHWEKALDSVDDSITTTSANHNRVTADFPKDDILGGLDLHLLDGQKDIVGADILKRFITGHPLVKEVLEGLGTSRMQALGHLEEVLQSIEPPEAMETPKTQTETSKALDILREVGHHYKGQDPLHWKPRMQAYDPEEMGPSDPKKPTSWHITLGKRARSALQAKALSDRLVEDIQRHGVRAEGRNFAHLYDTFQTENDGNQSVMKIVMDELQRAKTDKGVHAFPEHLNALRHNRDTSVESRQRALAQFLFCLGRAMKPVDTPKWTTTTGMLPVGYPDADEKSGEMQFHTAGVGYIKPMATFKSAWFKRYFGIHHEEAATPSVSEYTDPLTGAPLGHATSSSPKTFLPMNANVVNHVFSGITRHLPDIQPGLLYDNVDEGQVFDVEARQPDQNIMLSLDALTDVDLLYKSDKKDSGRPIPIKAMHRIFDLDDLTHLRGFSGDWVASSWPQGERVMIEKLKTKIKVHDAQNEEISLPNKVLEGIKDAHSAKFLIDGIWDTDTLHIVDIISSGDEKMENMPSKDRIRHLRAQFSASEGVSIPAPINTKRVDSEGLERAVKDLLREKGVKQVLLRDADSTYMRGESRHPKWVLLTPEKELDVIVLESKANTHRIGIGPLFDDEGRRLGNRATKLDGDFYMDVGSVHYSGLKAGQYITVRVPSVAQQVRNKMRIYNLNGARYLRDSEAEGTDSIETLEIASRSPNPNVPHKVRVKKGTIHLEFPESHISFETEQIGHSYLLKQADSDSDYHLKLAESQREYWSPLAAVLLRSEHEATKKKDSKKANVVPEPPANHTKNPKKVLKPSERLLKDPKLTKQLIAALEMMDGLLKEKITFTGPKGLGIDFATPVESPSGPTTLTEPKNLPDHDPAHRQEKDGVCWCGAKAGQECEQGLAHKVEDCPKFSPPSKEKDEKHVKIPVS